MSILSGRNILIIGDENHQIVELEEALSDEQMNIIKVTCAGVSTADLKDKKIDIILLNHLHGRETCTSLLDELSNSIEVKEIPLFVLVDDNQEKIQQALMLGAADYITSSESTSSVVKKIKLIFGQPDNYSSPLIFELPPDNANVSKKGIKVFVVEDDSLLRNLLKTRLEASSYPHEFAIDGQDVIPKIKEFKPQVIILDLMLPMKSGFEILAELKASAELKSIPTIIFSNRDSQEDKQRVFTLGADRFYVKAMTDLSMLIETIEELAA